MGLGYRDLAAQLRGGIERGDYAPGSTLPKQADLAVEFGVNVKTVRNAVAMTSAGEASRSASFNPATDGRPTSVTGAGSAMRITAMPPHRAGTTADATR